MTQRYTIQAVIYPGDNSGYVAECLNLGVITQGQTLDETVQNLREAIQLHLEGEDPRSFIYWKALVSAYTSRQAVTSS